MNDHLKGCRLNDKKNKLQQEMKSYAHVWKSCAACAHEEDDIKKNKDDIRIYCKLVGWYSRSRNLQK